MNTLTDLSGLQKMCRHFGRLKCNDTMFLWDYANECSVKEPFMREDSERFKASERARFEKGGLWAKWK